MIRAPGTRPHSLSVSYAGEPFFLRVAGAFGMVVPSTLLAQAEEEHSNNQSCGFDARNARAKDSLGSKTAMAADQLACPQYLR